jgi:hypothetical protein
VDGGGPEGVAQGRGSHKLNSPINSIREDRPNLPSDTSGIDNGVVRSDVVELLIFVGVAGGGVVRVDE